MILIIQGCPNEKHMDWVKCCYKITIMSYYSHSWLCEFNNTLEVSFLHINNLEKI